MDSSRCLNGVLTIIVILRGITLSATTRSATFACCQPGLSLCKKLAKVKWSATTDTFARWGMAAGLRFGW